MRSAGARPKRLDDYWVQSWGEAFDLLVLEERWSWEEIEQVMIWASSDRMDGGHQWTGWAHLLTSAGYLFHPSQSGDIRFATMFRSWCKHQAAAAQIERDRARRLRDLGIK
jgi:hypothetical protein